MPAKVPEVNSVRIGLRVIHSAETHALGSRLRAAHAAGTDLPAAGVGCSLRPPKRRCDTGYIPPVDICRRIVR